MNSNNKKKIATYAPISRLEEKEGIVCERNENGKIIDQYVTKEDSGCITDTYYTDNGINDRKEGQYVRYHESGKLCIKADCIDHTMNGEYRCYDECGKIIIDANNERTIFYKNGVLQAEHHYQTDIDNKLLIWCEDEQEDDEYIYVNKEVANKIKKKIQEEFMTALHEVSVIPDLAKIMCDYLVVP